LTGSYRGTEEGALDTLRSEIIAQLDRRAALLTSEASREVVDDQNLRAMQSQLRLKMEQRARNDAEPEMKASRLCNSILENVNRRAADGADEAVVEDPGQMLPRDRLLMRKRTREKELLLERTSSMDELTTILEVEGSGSATPLTSLTDELRGAVKQRASDQVT